MSDADDLQIGSGGIVAVDTETLRAAATALRGSAGTIDGIRSLLDRADGALPDGIALWSPAPIATDAAELARSLAADVDAMADVYELVELDVAERAATAAGDTATAADLAARADALAERNPLAAAAVAEATLDWRRQVPEALRDQYGLAAIPFSSVLVDQNILTLIAATAIHAVGAGTVPLGTRLAGRPTPVTVTLLGGSRTAAPTSLTQTVDRIPQGEGRVRVERYTMADGSHRFVAYVAGTAVGGPEDEAWDGASNLSLYTRVGGASYDATLEALAASGAAPGDEVSLVGYSQGAMVASYLTLSGDYDVPTLITFGDPVQADVGADTLSVAVRHLEDPVSALADGGFAAGVGSPGSFVATRETPGTAIWGEGMIGQHGLDAYRDTAKMLDASTDPRMDAVRERFAALGDAESVVAFVYGAERDPAMTVEPGQWISGGIRAADAE